MSEVTMTLAASVTLTNIIDYILTDENGNERDLTFDLKYKLLRNKNVLAEDFYKFNEKRVATVRELGVVNEETNTVSVPDEKMEEFKNSDKENKFGESAVITLIKAGSFDRLEGKNRVEIMKDYIRKISKPLTSLRMDDIEILNSLGLLTDAQKAYEYRLYRFRKYVYNNQFLAEKRGKSPNTFYYRLERQYPEPYFFEHFETNMEEGKDYEYDNDGYIIVKRGSLDREYDKLMADFKKNVLQKQKYLDAVTVEEYMQKKYS